MKPPSYWRDILCNKFVINTKEPGVIEKFIKEVQEDAIRGYLEAEDQYDKEYKS